jgi:MFS family permease
VCQKHQLTPISALKFTLPTIIQQMGFTSSNAQLMTIPCYCLGAISAFVSARFSDKCKRRMPFIVAAQTLVVIAFCIMAPLAPKIKQNIGPCYFAICLACLGFYPINPGGNAWTSNNLAGPTKRAMGMAYMICMGEERTTRCDVLGTDPHV